MEIYEGLQFEPFSKADIPVFTPIMKRAFDEDMLRHTGKPHGGPDGYDNGDFLRKWYINQGAKAYKVTKDGDFIGAFNVWINRKGGNYLGNIFVDPDCQDKGIGTSIWRFIESKYPTEIWRTETPAFSRRNHNFYINKCGFKVVKIENPKKASGGSYILEKTYKNIRL